MPSGKGYVYSDFSKPRALYLDIEGTIYEVAQFASSWAVNEIPTAVCMLAVGREVRTLNPAKIHTADQHVQMKRAKVFFSPDKEYSLLDFWPPGPQVIFDGYFTGFGHRKVSGKIVVTANLLHWLAALGCSSATTRNGHIANPTQLNCAAVYESLGGAGAGQGNFISSLVTAQLIQGLVSSNLWEAIKTLFCKLAGVETQPVGPANGCEGGGNYRKNDYALEALSRIEGPGAECSKDYRWGVPLPFDTLGISMVANSVSNSIGQETIESYSGTSFWDKLVGQFCPQYGMAIVPRVNDAIVIADVPALRGTFWKQLEADQYDSTDGSDELLRPVRAVGVMGGWDSQTQAGIVEPGQSLPIIGGCYVEDSVRPGDGMIQYVHPPAWLRELRFPMAYYGYNSNLSNDGPSQTSTTDTSPPVPPETPETFGAQANVLYCRFAHDVYVNLMLRGKVGAISGKLRFDIAPGSIVKIVPSLERHLGGEDQLAVTQFACVSRVTIAINAEAAVAGTTLVLSHKRTEAENTANRTSVAEHPLFGKAIHGDGKHGAPLIDEYNLA